MLAPIATIVSNNRDAIILHFCECNEASTEAELANRIASLDDNVAQRTKDDEFNPFR